MYAVSSLEREDFGAFFLDELKGRKIPVKMANLEEKKDEHREQFEEWLSIHAKSERSSIVSTTEYEAIKRYLLNSNQSESKLIEMSKDE